MNITHFVLFNIICTSLSQGMMCRFAHPLRSAFPTASRLMQPSAAYSSRSYKIASTPTSVALKHPRNLSYDFHASNHKKNQSKNNTATGLKGFFRATTIAAIAIAASDDDLAADATNPMEPDEKTLDPKYLDKLSNTNPQGYNALIEHIAKNPSTLDNFYANENGIIRLLLYTPAEQYNTLILALTAHFDTTQREHLSEKAYCHLAQLIADIVILFDLDINIAEQTKDKAFAHLILQSMSELQESYAYHADIQNIGEIKTQIVKTLHKELDRYNITLAPKRQGHSPETQNSSPMINYVRRKLAILGFEQDEIELIYADHLCMRGGKILGISPYSLLNYSPLGLNWGLTHEMMHRDDRHYEQSDKILETSPRNYNPLKIYQEKFADILACIHVGPKACTAAAFTLFKMGNPRDPKGYYSFSGPECHAPSPVRTSALLNLSHILTEKELHPENETALVKWLNCHGSLPEHEEFVRLFFQCENQCTPGTPVIISPEGKGTGTPHSIILEAPHHKWMLPKKAKSHRRTV